MQEKDLFGLDRTEVAIQLLKQLEPPEGYFLAFSGGKDSMVLYEIARLAGVKFEAHYHVTSVDPPELIAFIRRHYPDVINDRPEKTMWELIPSEKVPPTRLMRYCCEVLKESQGKGRVLLTGIRADESTKRRNRKMVAGCQKRGNVIINPILWWTENDVWTFIRSRGLEYCRLYDEGFKRLGCIGCPMAGPDGQRREFARWPKYRAAYLRSFQRMVDRRKAEGLNPFAKCTTGEEVMAWWLKEPEQEEDDSQPLFS